MKTLFLVRHAKANPPQQGLPDHDRVLNDRGRRDAPEMGRRLAQRGLRPDLVITSTAARARATAHLLAAELGARGLALVVANPSDRVAAMFERSGLLAALGALPPTPCL